MMTNIRLHVAALALAAGFTAQFPAFADDITGPARERERQMIAVLQSEAPPQEKAITCKRLAVYGSKEAVPALAPLLTIKELNSWARIALEAIPDRSADDALRAALAKTQGRLLIGVMNSIGFRRDAAAVEPLIAKLKDADAEVAAAAASALGRIGGAQAAGALEPLLATAPTLVRSEAADGCVRIAERYLADGKRSDAIRLYDLVRQAPVPKQRVLEGSRGAILARGTKDGLPLLVEMLKSPDKAIFNIALTTARELPGREVTEAVAAEWERAEASRQTPLVMVLADRGDPAVLSTIRKAAQSQSKPMRLAAVGALERMGTVAAVPVLLDMSVEEDADISKAAKAALVRLPGKEVNPDIVARLPQSSGKTRRALVDVVGQRRIAEALPAVVSCASDPDETVRRAAIVTIGLIGEEKQAGALVAMLPKAQTPREREEVEKALVGICGRRGAGCLPQVLPLAQSPDAANRLTALHALAGIGGAQALAAVTTAVEDKNTEVQDEAVRTLSTWPSNWPEDDGVAAPLLKLARSSGKTSHQVLGLRGALDYAQSGKKLKEDDRVAMVKDLLPLITRPEEKRQAIAALGAAPTTSSLEMLITFAGEPAVAEEACLSLLNIAGKDDLKNVSKELRQQAAQTVVSKSKRNTTKRRAEEILARLK
jgi:HEAT repeat protein